MEWARNSGITYPFKKVTNHILSVVNNGRINYFTARLKEVSIC